MEDNRFLEDDNASGHHQQSQHVPQQQQSSSSSHFQSGYQPELFPPGLSKIKHLQSLPDQQMHQPHNSRGRTGYNPVTHNRQSLPDADNQNNTTYRSNYPAPDPSTSEMYPNQAPPLKGRIRVSKACDRCRSQKIKCSGTFPCSTCIRHKKDCKYSKNDNNPETALKRHKVDDDSPFENSAGGADSPKDQVYVRSLENRVKYLESLLSADSDTLFREDPSPNADMSKWVQLISSSSKWRFSRRHQNIMTIDLCQYVYNTLSEESRKQVTLPRTQYFGWNMSGVHYLSPENLPEEPEFDLSREQETVFIDFFFKEVNMLYAILHETVFREQVELFHKLREAKMQEPTNIRVEEEPEQYIPKGKSRKRQAASQKENEKEKVPPLIQNKNNQTKLFSAKLYLVFAIAIRFIEFQKPQGPSLEMLQLEEMLFKYSHRVVEILAFEWESVELIQSWLLIALYLRLTHRQNSAYSALGRAITMTRSMGLGFEVPVAYKATPYELLKAKRIFWAVYTFDRLIGLQLGRYCGLRDNDIYRRFPSRIYEEEKDDWMTLPAFVMLHIARISNFVHTLSTDTPPLLKFEQINKEVEDLDVWFKEIGFADDDVYKRGQEEGEISSMVKAQAKLHYYDLVISIHGRGVFNFVGRVINNEGLKLPLIISSCEGIIKLFNRINGAKLLTTPWYLTLLLLYNVGITSLTFINGGYEIPRNREIFRCSINLIMAIRKSNVKEGGKIINRDRFKMAKECLWALKMTNHIVMLRLQEDIENMNKIGVDHGSADVNEQNFGQFGKHVSKNGLDSNEHLFTGNIPKNQKYGTRAYDRDQELKSRQLANNGNVIVGTPLEEDPNRSLHKRLRGLEEEGEDEEDSQTNNQPTPASDTSSTSANNFVQPAGEVNDPLGNDLLGNLQWFDQWLDFNYDL
ncbi:hypothetical protein CLIB1423_04S05710 [[Candida] railenensis]|uniref:Zn(2)-C6 fungal-type domain-containing protein n=1 Tax=[Candida] railenensis TaxID=45579 RepID=A0A9P0QN31_9ASCO|nr:hypothetical protein CLIB1423_04S05710 [[Candida] railenensis]